MTLKITLERPFDSNKAIPWMNIKRCILDLNGNIIGYLNKDNSNLWADSSVVNWSTVENSGWNVMVEIPKFYYKKVGFNESTTDFISGHDWYISTTVTGFDLHPAFYRCRDKLCDDQSGVAIEVDYRYAPAFLGWVDGNGRLRSLPNKSPNISTTIGNFRNYAKANGNGWGIMDYNLLFAIQLLYSVEYGNYDSQTALGRGYVDGNSGKINTGGTLQYGNNSFGETTGKKQMSYRGIEDFWGNCYYWVDGFFCDSSRNILIGNKGFNNTGNGYNNKGKGMTSILNGYIGNIQSNKECGFVVSVTGGTMTSKFFDLGYLNGGCLAVAGANWDNASFGGAFRFYCGYSASNAYSHLGASLAF